MVKNPVWSLLWLKFSLWPTSFHMPQAWPKKKGGKKRKKGGKKEKSSSLQRKLIFFFFFFFRGTPVAYGGSQARGSFYFGFLFVLSFYDFTCGIWEFPG